MNMENFDEVVFDDDELDDIPAESNEDTTTEETVEKSSNEQIDDLTEEVLKSKGITDPDKIKFEDENGNIVERSWDSLDRTEQINILSDQQPEQEQLDKSEIDLINYIRGNGLTVDEFIDQMQQPQVAPEPKRYNVDDLSDDEVYALDLLHKVGEDLTDEEISSAIESAKQNEDLYAKTIEGLRKEYIRLQEEEEVQKVNEQAAIQQEQYNAFASNIINEIRGLDEFAGQPLQLSEEDVEDLSSFILDIDERGMSAFGRAMNDPKFFTKAAFWILNEDKIIDELNNQIQENYRRGYEQAKFDLQGGNKSKLVVNKPTSQKKTTDDVFIDDEEWF